MCDLSVSSQMQKETGQKTADIIWQNSGMMVRGDLDFCNVMAIYQRSLQLVGQFSLQCPMLIFDFASLRSCNSAGLALMIEWIKLAKRMGKPIQFLHLPEGVMVLAKAAGLDEVLTHTCQI